MKSLINKINEGKQIKYDVAFIDCKDSDGSPITVSVLVNNENEKIFEDFLKKEQDNIFVHAEGGNIEY